MKLYELNWALYLRRAGPVPGSCPALRRWYADFATRPSATPPVYPEPVLSLAQGLPKLCPPTSA